MFDGLLMAVISDKIFEKICWRTLCMTGGLAEKAGSSLLNSELLLCPCTLMASEH